MSNSSFQSISTNSSNNNENDVFKNMINYFELTPKTLNIKIPYSFNNAIDYLKNISLDNFSSDLNEIIQVEESKADIYDEQSFSIDNILFLSSKLSDNDKLDYILLKDLKNENYNYINNK